MAHGNEERITKIPYPLSQDFFQINEDVMPSLQSEGLLLLLCFPCLLLHVMRHLLEVVALETCVLVRQKYAHHVVAIVALDKQLMLLIYLGIL